MMSRQDPNFSYFNEDGKLVTGAAATVLEFYTVHGGVAEYNDYIGETYIKEFVREHSEILQRGIEVESRRKKLRVISNDKRKLG